MKNLLNNPKLKKVFIILVYIFAAWGFILTGVFFAMKLGLTKTSGLIDDQSSYFAKLYKDSEKKGNDIEREKVANQNWNGIKNLQEWSTVKSGITKDAGLINSISAKTGVPSRLLIAPLVAEQLRLMTSERTVFKQFLQPLSVLGTQTQFSLGIYGIKEKTAEQIERNLKDSSSPYYLGPEYEHMLDYTVSSTTIRVDANTWEQVKTPINNNSNSTSTNASSTNSVDNSTSTIVLTGSDAERVLRLTDKKDHTYSYLYAALYLKEIMTAWKNAGYDISDRPEIVATVYNLGFQKSIPKANPEVGGAEIQLNGQKYSFGSIAFYFYFSDEMKDLFNK